MLKEIFRDSLQVLMAYIIKGELNIQRETILVKGKARIDLDLKALIDLFNYLVRKAIKNKEDIRTSPREVSYLGLYKNYFKPAIIILLRENTSLEVNIRKLRLSKNLNIKEDILLLISKDLIRSLYRYSKLIN